MSGPRVTSGEDSKQDYSTPADFLQAVEGRFGPPVFDLAAHAENKRCSRYFAPAELVYQYQQGKEDPKAVVKMMCVRGAREEDVKAALRNLPTAIDPTKKKVELRVKNSDTNAVALDAFVQNWAMLSQTIRNLDDTPGLLWLNCEFNDVVPWATKCFAESRNGANITLLTPAMVGANWYRDLIAGKADVYHLNGRICFDGKHPYPKDCMLSHFHPDAKGKLAVWNWKHDVLTEEWVRAPHRLSMAAVAA